MHLGLPADHAKVELVRIALRGLALERADPILLAMVIARPCDVVTVLLQQPQALAMQRLSALISSSSDEQ